MRQQELFVYDGAHHVLNLFPLISYLERKLGSVDI